MAREGYVRANTASQSLAPPIHVHINNHPSVAKANINLTEMAGPSTRNSRKRSHSTVSTEESSDSDDDDEAMLLSYAMDKLHRKFPQLDLPQYMPIFEKEDIIYAESVPEFDKDFYTDLGLTEGAVGRLLSGVKKLLKAEKREKKRVRAYNRQMSLEI